MANGAGAPFETRCFIAGQWRSTTQTLAVRNKLDGQVIADVSAAGPADVSDAVTACQAAFEAGAPTPYERSEVLRRAADLLRAERERFASIYMSETGFTHADAEGEVARTVETLTVSAEEARRFDQTETVPLSGAPGPKGRLAFVLRMPIGPVAAITPFNAPLNTVSHKVAPAVAAGNPIILKPSSHTPLCGAAIIDLLLRAGHDPNACALLQGSGDVGAALLEESGIAFYTFTGSTEVGRAVQRGAGLRRTQLELGSIAFTIVARDADLDRAARAIAGAAYRKAGQVCTSVQIALIDRAVLADMRERLVEETRNTPFGDPARVETRTGPMISEAAARRAEAHVRAAVEKGATVLAGGVREGSVLAPTLLDAVPEGSVVLTEELFAPILSIVPFDTLDEAIARVNATPYGLATGLFTARIDNAFAAARGLRVGTVHVNNSSSARVDLMPYGGVKDSGFGREGPAYAMREMSEERLITFTP